MCLIVSKGIGVNHPKLNDMKRWFKANDDGMGAMFRDGMGDVRIVKGIMINTDIQILVDTIKSYIKPLQFRDIEIVYHFRQATRGIVNPHNCHPFAISDDKRFSKLLDFKCPMAIAHNGMIYDYAKYEAGKWSFDLESGKTDTQRFVEDYLVGMGNTIFNPSVQKLIAEHTDSKFAILSRRGIDYIGDFVTDSNGLIFSNSSYKEHKDSSYSCYGSGYSYYSGYGTKMYYDSKEEMWREVEKDKIKSADDDCDETDDLDKFDYCDICGNAFGITHMKWIDDEYLVCQHCHQDIYNKALMPIGNIK